MLTCSRGGKGHSAYKAFDAYDESAAIAAMPVPPFMQKICGAALIAGFVRSGVKSGDATVIYFTPELNGNSTPEKWGRRPLLATERIFTAFAGAVVYRYLFPILIWKDLRQLEVSLRGLDSKKYDTETTTIVDAIF
jgi:hypothetical protein